MSFSALGGPKASRDRIGNANGMTQTVQRYRPIQPALALGVLRHPSLSYREIPPAPRLADVVHCFWTISGEVAPLQPHHYRIVADGCVDLILNCHRDEGLIVAGTNTHWSSTTLVGNVQFFGMRFLPATIHRVLDFPSQDAAGVMAKVDAVLGKPEEELGEMLFAQASLSERIAVAEAWLTKQIAARDVSLDTRVLRALDLINSSRGALDIEHNDELYVSPRQLRRLFQRYVGVGPKQLAKVVRFQHSIAAMLRSPDSGAITVDGYYDQSHLIRDFNQMLGLPPGALFRAEPSPTRQ